jgi:hypothetical protein
MSIMNTPPVGVIAEIHGFSEPGAEPLPGRWDLSTSPPRILFGCPRFARMAGRTSRR